MSVLADVPSWYWQVLGAICGLGLGLWLGAIRRKRARLARAVVAEMLPRNNNGRPQPEAVPAAPAPVAPVNRPVERPQPPAPAPAPSVPPTPSAAAPAPAPVPAPVAPKPEPTPRPPEPAADAALATLQEHNTELTHKLRAANDVHARELLEKSQQFQAERLKFERQVDDLRQAHSSELSRLMGLMVEQVDTLHQDYGQRIRQLEAELERLKLELGHGGNITTATTTEVRSVGMMAPPPQPARR